MAGPYWTKAWNWAQGCTHSGSPGCDFCWAKAMHERFHAEPFSKVVLHPERLSLPLRTRKPQTFFCDMFDPFHPDIPFEFIAAMFGVMAAAQRHTFLVLTKRAERMRKAIEWIEYEAELLTSTRPDKDPSHPAWRLIVCNRQANRILDEAGLPTYDAKGDRIVPRHEVAWPLPNVWLGVTAEDQDRADERIPLLLQTPAAHRWVSLEPLLEEVDLDEYVWAREPQYGGILGATPSPLDELIIGGESGPNARPYDLAWPRKLIKQARTAGVSCFHKQVGSNAYQQTVWRNGFAGGVRFLTKSRSGADPNEWPADLRVRELAWRNE